MRHKTRLFFVANGLLFLILCGASAGRQTENALAQKEPISVIFDTDISGDYDDVGAIAMLHALADNGEAKILATMASNLSPLVAPTIEVFNRYYGRPDIPIGVPKGRGVTQDSRELRWPDSLMIHYPHTLNTNEDAPDAVTVYREILTKQPDTSVTIISVGFLTNLKSLLMSAPDDISPLDGKELVAKKVKRWVAMAGRFPDGKETNVRRDSAASKYAIDHWPTPILFSGFEIGVRVRTGLHLIKADVPDSPVKMAYAISIPKRPYDKNGRPSWDQTAVLAAVRGTEPYYTTKRGRFITHPDGSNNWTNDPDGPHSYLVEKMDAALIAQEIESLMMQLPARIGRRFDEK